MGIPALSMSSALPAADPDKPFWLGWDLSRDRAGFVCQGVSDALGKPEFPGRRMEAPGLWDLSPPRSQGWNFGDPQALHTHRMGSRVRLGASDA